MGLRVIPKNLNDRQVKRVNRIESSDPLRARTVASRISARRDARGAENPQMAKMPGAKPAMTQPMKKGGKIIKKAQNGILSKISKKASEIKAKYNAFNKSIDDDAAYSKKTFKTADSLKYANPKIGPKGLQGMLDEKASNRRKADSLVKTVEKRVGVPRELNMYDNKKHGGRVKKAKSGGSFPDLNKDGKITKADILKGRGVIAKSGTKMKKGGKAMYGKSMMKKGGKCKNGC